MEEEPSCCSAKNIIPCTFNNYKDMCNLLKAKGYEVIISEWEPIIKYGGNHRWLKFHKFCKEIKVNNNSWGNIIASKDKKLISYIYKQSI